MKRIIILMGLVVCFSLSMYAQNTLDDLELYNSPSDIINGSRWVDKSFVYEGHPFWGNGKWLPGTIWFDGKEYKDVQMRYDIHEDDLIIYDNKRRQSHVYYKLKKRRLESFAFFDSDGKKHHFKTSQQLNLNGLDMKNQIYDIVYKGDVIFLMRYKKAIKNIHNKNKLGKYSETLKMFLVQDGELNRFSSKKSLLNLLQDHKQELKKYIRSEGLKIGKLHPEHITRLLMHHDQLN